MNVGREGSDYDTFSLALLEELIKGLTNCAFRVSITRTLSISRVSHESEYASAAKLTKSCKVDYFAVNRGVVDFEVAGVYDNTGRSVYSHTN